MSETVGQVDTTPALRVENLTTMFHLRDGAVTVVDDISFTLQPGRILAVVGESGSGKSVTARSILGLLRAPGKVDAGKVLLHGVNLLDLSEQAMRGVRGKQIAMVFQDPQSALNPVMRVGDQIAEALIVHGATARAARRRTVELMLQVGIPDPERAIENYPHQFSGGMRQRVVIAIALANKPSILIADEPTTALDVTIQAQILHLLADLRRELGLSIMVITHDMGIVAELCDDLVVMYGGRVVESGPVKDVFAAPKHPYTAALLHAVPRIKQTSGSRLVAIPGSPVLPSNLPKGCAFNPRCELAVERCTTSKPPLLQVAPGRSAACWQTECIGRKTPVLPQVQAARSRKAPSGKVALSVVDLKTDVARASGLFRREKPVYAVDGVSLEVRLGETLGLVGESGCGKSTLSRTIVGIRKAAAGMIAVDGRDVTAQTPEDRRHLSAKIQYVFQDPYASLNPRRTIGQSLDEALATAGVKGKEAASRAVALLSRVGLAPDYLGRYPHELSGGQRQRVGIARAIATEPDTLICDEPVSALDVSIQAQIINLLEELQDELGLAYLFIAHDLAVVRHISDRIAVMYLGTIVEIGEAEQVYSRPQHPYTAALLSSICDPTPAVGAFDGKLPALAGDMPSLANPPSGCRFRTRCPIGPEYLPDRDICKSRVPQLRRTPTGQMAACHFAAEAAAG